MIARQMFDQPSANLFDGLAESPDRIVFQLAGTAFVFQRVMLGDAVADGRMGDAIEGSVIDRMNTVLIIRFANSILRDSFRPDLSGGFSSSSPA